MYIAFLVIISCIMKVFQWMFQYQQILPICPDNIQQGLSVFLFS